jgi:hypothetical protein
MRLSLFSKQVEQPKPLITSVTRPITDNDLRWNQYDVRLLERYVDQLSPRILLRTQKLTPEFCLKFILDDGYAWTDSDRSITYKEVLALQPHITLEQLVKC